MGKGRMARILEADMKRAQGKRSERTEGLQAQISTDALMSAVRHEGKYIMGAEGKGYWRDMQRRYPHLNLLKHKDTGDSPNGSRNHFGRVTRRFKAGLGWLVYQGGEWVPDTTKQESRFSAREQAR
jgi:hypothetical protein